MSDGKRGLTPGGAPIVSIVVPCYMKASYLLETLDSVCAQDYPNWELIVVNDGSPDDTSAIVRSFAAAHPHLHVRLIEQQNGGVSHARNRGLQESNGCYLMSLDADDKLHPAYLGAAVALLERQKANFFCSAQQNFGADSSEWAPDAYNEYAIRYSNCITTAALYERAFFDATGGYNRGMGYAEDWEYWIRCSKFGIQLCRAKEPLFLYRASDEGLAATFIEGRYKDCMSLIAIANSGLYPVEEVLMAHEHLPNLSDAARGRLITLNHLHPNEWLLKFCLGVLAEAQGTQAEAMKLYWQAVESAGEGKWQALVRLACLAEAAGQHEEAKRLYRLVHTLRPDMSRFVLPKIVKLG